MFFWWARSAKMLSATVIGMWFGYSDHLTGSMTLVCIMALRLMMSLPEWEDA